MTSRGELFDVVGRTAVVTGGTSGIGRMIAEGLVRAGCRVYICARKADDCARVAEELRRFGMCEGVPADLATESGCADFAATVATTWPTLDILVNNAGATWGAELEGFDDRAWDRVLDLNVKGLFHTTRYFLPMLRAASRSGSPSRVVNIGSVDGLCVSELHNAPYGASKAAVHMLTRQLAYEVAPSITVNCICPGPFDSRMMSATMADRRDHLLSRMPLAREGRPDDVVGATLFLASRAGSFLTGTLIPVDGGWSTVGRVRDPAGAV